MLLSQRERVKSPPERVRSAYKPSCEPLEPRVVLTIGPMQALPGFPKLPFVPHQLLVGFHPESTPSSRLSVVQRLGAASTSPATQNALDSAGLTLLSLPRGVGMAAAIERLRLESNVAFISPNWIVRTADVSNDPLFVNGSLWGTYGDDPAISPTAKPNAFGSQAEEAWSQGYLGSQSVYVGIVDEGVMTHHEDLAANIWINPYDPIDGIDNDGNGYVDDIHGWDFVNNDNSVFDGVIDDHGTHVAGTIGAAGGNGIGAVGVNWNVTLITAKFIGKSGGTIANAIRALDYITDLKRRHGLNIVATNNSWTGGAFTRPLLDAITRGALADILFIAAAGNGGSDGVGDNNDVSPTYPASYSTLATAGYEAVVSVAALTPKGLLAPYSNFGPTSVDIAAPGSAIHSTLPHKEGTSHYGARSGTSMAAAHVTGAVALYASIYPGATAVQMRQALLESATPTASLLGKVGTGGRLNIGALITQSPGGESGLRTKAWPSLNEPETLQPRLTRTVLKRTLAHMHLPPALLALLRRRAARHRIRGSGLAR